MAVLSRACLKVLKSEMLIMIYGWCIVIGRMGIKKILFWFMTTCSCRNLKLCLLVVVPVGVKYGLHGMSVKWHTIP